MRKHKHVGHPFLHGDFFICALYALNKNQQSPLYSKVKYRIETIAQEFIHLGTISKKLQSKFYKTEQLTCGCRSNEKFFFGRLSQLTIYTLEEQSIIVVDE